MSACYCSFNELGVAMYENDPSSRPSGGNSEIATSSHQESDKSSDSANTPAYVHLHGSHHEDRNINENPVSSDNSSTLENKGDDADVLYTRFEGNGASHINDEVTDDESHGESSAVARYLESVHNLYGDSVSRAAPRNHHLLPQSSNQEREELGGMVANEAHNTRDRHADLQFRYPHERVPYSYEYNSISAPVNRNILVREPSNSGQGSNYPSVNVAYVDGDVPRVYKSESLRSESTVKNEDTGDDADYIQGKKMPSIGEGDAAYGYETNPYTTSNLLDYDSTSQIDVSFAALERRDMESEISLPIANIGRVMKSVLPSSAKIAKHAKDIIRECVTEFIMFISSEASDICTNERRKTLSADDVLGAMNSLGFERYNEALRSYHNRWRERGQSSMMESFDPRKID